MRLTLQNQILIALLLLTLIFISILGINFHQFSKDKAYQNNLFITKAVTERSVDLASRAMKYGEVAPRDFAAYERDIKLFYPNLQNDLKALDVSVQALDSIDANRGSVRELQDFHQAFNSGLWEKLGDKDEPRLEWGADYLAEQAPLLRDQAQSLEAVISASTEQQLKFSKNLSRLSWLAGLIAILSIVFWFWKRVTSRIKAAADSCLKVAKGEFGTRIEDDSHDEIGAFSGAFNSLSARTRVVLGVLDKLPANANSQQAFTTIWNEGHNYLGHQWQGMFMADKALTKGKVLATNDNLTTTLKVDNAVFAFENIGKTLDLKNKGYAIWENIREHTLDSTESKLLRELSRRGLQTLVLVLLKDDEQEYDRILAFAWEKTDPKTTGVADFLGSLSKFLHQVLGGK